MSREHLDTVFCVYVYIYRDCACRKCLYAGDLNDSLSGEKEDYSSQKMNK